MNANGHESFSDHQLLELRHGLFFRVNVITFICGSNLLSRFSRRREVRADVGSGDENGGGLIGFSSNPLEARGLHQKSIRLHGPAARLRGLNACLRGAAGRLCGRAALLHGPTACLHELTGWL